MNQGGDIATSPVREGRSFSIKISSVTGTNLDIDVKTSDSVQELKDRIFNCLHIMPEYQRLTFNEKVLEYGVLEDYGIDDGSTITLSPVLKAGTASSTKRSLNIDQKSVSELIRSLPQEQLAILLNQKKPVTVTAKIGDHVVVFTLVPSENNEQVSSPSSPSPSSSESSHNHNHHHHHHHHHRSSRSSTHVCYHNSVIEAIPSPSTNITLVDRVQLIKKRLALVKRTIDEVNQGQEAECRKRHHHHHHHHHHHSRRQGSNRVSRRLHRHRRNENVSSEQKQEQQNQILLNEQQQEQTNTTNDFLKLSESEQAQVEKELSVITEPSTPMSVPPTPEPSSAFSPSPSSCEDMTPSLRCSKCSKKLKPTKSFTCKCGHIFCIDHRHQNFNLSSEKGHNCSFDFKALGREEIRASNPLIQGPKIQHI